MKPPWDFILRAAAAFHDVTSFGATGDGRSDDTAAIQSAIAAAQAGGGGTVFFPAGTYVISATLRVSSDGITLAGEGYASEIRNRDRTRLTTMVLVESRDPSRFQIRGVTVRDLRLNGNRAAQRGRYESKNIRIVPSTAVDQPAMIVVENVWAHGAFSGFLPIEGGGISLEGSSHALPGGVVQRDYSPQSITVRGCHCWDNGGWGIGTNWTNGVVIADNICSGNATMGITLWNTQDTVVTGNVCFGNGDYGINVEASDRITVAGNSARSATAGALKIYNSEDLTVTGNTLELTSDFWLKHVVSVRSGPGYGERRDFKQRPSRRILVASNTIVMTASSTDGYALSVDAPDADTPAQFQSDVTVTANVIRNDGVPHKGVAITAQGGIVLSGNRVTGCVHLDGGGAGDVVCDGNYVVAAPRQARDVVTVVRGDLVSVAGNRVRCGGAAVGAVFAYLAAEARRLVIESNVADGRFGELVRNAAVRSGAVIRGNTPE